MKKLLFFTLLMAIFATSYGQNATVNSAGDIVEKVIFFKTSREATARCEATTFFYRDREMHRYRVYKDQEGRTFYAATNDAGQLYRRYFTLDGDTPEDQVTWRGNTVQSPVYTAN